MATRVMFHGCDHEFQDQKFGERQRVFNQCVSSGASSKWRCTVCAVEIQMEKKADPVRPEVNDG